MIDLIQIDEFRKTFNWTYFFRCSIKVSDLESWPANSVLFFISLLNFSQIMLIIEVNNHKNLPKLLVNKKIIDFNMIELHL